MIDKLKRNFPLLLLGFLFLAFSVLCMYYLQYTQNNLGTVSVRYDKASISPKQIEHIKSRMKKDHKTGLQGITLWNRMNKETIANKITELPVNVNVIEVYGDMSRILPMNFLSGNYVYEDDKKGCVLDAETSFKLFGTTNAVNNTVIWKDKKYTVRGVAAAKDTMMLVQSVDRNSHYTNAEAYYPAKCAWKIADNQGKQFSDLLHDNGLPQPDAVIDGVLNLWILHIICKLPLWIVTFYGAILLVKCTYKMRYTRILFVLSGIGTLLILSVMLHVTGFSIHLPSQFIPTKWSDFNFYIDKYHQLKNNIQNNNNITPMPLDILRDSIRAKCCLLSAANILILILFYLQIRNPRYHQNITTLSTDNH